MPKNQEENQIKPAQTEEGAPQEAPQETPQEEKNGHKGLIKNERVSFITGVILIIFSIYMTISFISFLFTGSVDQSKIENLSIGELSSISNDIQNWTGAFGAYLSNLMINRWMGISAFIVALWLYVVGRRFIKVSHTRMIRFTITCALSIIVLSPPTQVTIGADKTSLTDGETLALNCTISNQGAAGTLSATRMTETGTTAENADSCLSSS